MEPTSGTSFMNGSQYRAADGRQQYEFCDAWVLIEGADQRWPAQMASEEGLSIDDSADIVRSFPEGRKKKLKLIQHGWAADKSELRNRYAQEADDGVLIVFDADEFLTKVDLGKLIERVASERDPSSVRIPHVHFWKNDKQIITGGYYDVPHDRAYRVKGGVLYRENHNHPCVQGDDGRGWMRLNEINHACYDRKFVTTDDGLRHDGPAWLHYGFVKEPQHVAAKNQYYVARGEATTRPGTTRDRAAFFGELPAECSIHQWSGAVPEVFQGSR